MSTRAHYLKTSSTVLCALGLFGAALVACGDSSGDGGSGGSGGDGTTTSTTTSTTKATSTSGTTTGTTTATTSTGMMVDCSNPIEITLGAFSEEQSDGSVGLFSAEPSPTQGEAEADVLFLEFYGSAVDPAFNGEDTGTFDLTMNADNNYATCSRCIRMIEDPMVPGRTFFTASGTMNIDAASTQLDGTVTATLTDVLLVEVTIDPDTFESTPVANGACLHIATADVQAAPPVVPMGWTCDPEFYADDLCDCGCGAFDDLDCTDMTVGSCDYCDDMGSCSMDACPGTIDPANNATCTM